MGEVLSLFLSMLGGSIAGVIFFGGLWYSVLLLPKVSKPKLFFLQSYMLRTVFVLALLYFSTGYDFWLIIGYSIGFLGMRSFILRWLVKKE